MGFPTSSRNTRWGSQGKTQGTFSWDDFVCLLELWGRYSPLQVEPDRFSEDDLQRREIVPLILFIASRLFSFVFQVVRVRDDDVEAILASFYNRYYQSWRRLLADQGVDELQGQAWDDQPLAKLLGNSYRLK